MRIEPNDERSGSRSGTPVTGSRFGACRFAKVVEVPDSHPVSQVCAQPVKGAHWLVVRTAGPTPFGPFISRNPHRLRQATFRPVPGHNRLGTGSWLGWSEEQPWSSNIPTAQMIQSVLALLMEGAYRCDDPRCPMERQSRMFSSVGRAGRSDPSRTGRCARSPRTLGHQSRSHLVVDRRFENRSGRCLIDDVGGAAGLMVP